MKHRVPFGVSELGPNVDPFMLHIYAAVAEQGRSFISGRTKKALAAKARGVKLGNPNGAAHLKALGNSSAVEAVKVEAQVWAEGLAGVIANIKAEGITSAHGIAGALNARHIATTRGGRWTARSILNVLERLTA